MTTNRNNREMQYTKVSSEVLRETEKAYQLKVYYWTKADKPAKEAKMWCPKSCSKVENGIVVEVASFILDKWTKEHLEYVSAHSSYAAAHMTIEFDMARKEAIVTRQKEEKRQWCERHDEILNRIAAIAKPYADKFMQEMAWYCVFCGEAMKSVNKGFDASACDDMIAFGKKVAKVFGMYNSNISVEELKANYEALSKEEILMGFYVNIVDAWIFDGLRVAYDNTVACEGFTKYEFDEVEEDLKKKFKKYLEFKNAFGNIYDVLIK